MPSSFHPEIGGAENRQTRLRIEEATTPKCQEGRGGRVGATTPKVDGRSMHQVGRQVAKQFWRETARTENPSKCQMNAGADSPDGRASAAELVERCVMS